LVHDTIRLIGIRGGLELRPDLVFHLEERLCVPRRTPVARLSRYSCVSLRLNLMSEIARHQHEVVPLDAEGPHPDVEAEARAKECDYILYTVPTQVKEPGSGGLSPASLPKGVMLDPAKFQALTDVTLYKVGKPLPELKEIPLAADAGQFAVDAVTTTFVMESDRVDQQIAQDAHPQPGSRPSKAPAKRTASGTKPN
jgi:hypothetical protein